MTSKNYKLYNNKKLLRWVLHWYAHLGPTYWPITEKLIENFGQINVDRSLKQLGILVNEGWIQAQGSKMEGRG